MEGALIVPVVQSKSPSDRCIKPAEKRQPPLREAGTGDLSEDAGVPASAEVAWRRNAEETVRSRAFFIGKSF
jgi:hypothetical protein